MRFVGDLQGNFISESHSDELPLPTVTKSFHSGSILKQESSAKNVPYFLTIENKSRGIVRHAFFKEYPHYGRMPKIQRSCEGDSFLFHYSQCDTVYSVSDSVVYPKYLMHIHKYNTRRYLQRLCEMSQKEQLMEVNSRKSTKCFSGGIYESDMYFMFDYRVGEYSYNLLYNRESMQSYLFKHSVFNIEERTVTLFCPGLLFLTQNRVLSAFDYSYFERMSESAKMDFLSKLTSDDKSRLLERMKNPDTNPVICLFQLNI